MWPPRYPHERLISEQHACMLNDAVLYNRERLDSGLGDELFENFRNKEYEEQGQYRIILAGALMMRTGAKIKASHFQHLRDLVPKIPCQPGSALPFADLGFRGPGKAQFLAALDNYQPGTPRDFYEPRQD
ncbi:hypothetical protein CORC01_06505 [Colletotrichum orchidophilum]|uniref:Uncharacterized protein n=1 Tax=Colletotrichum orchidophilum TaxID=1209926 RepID=A0A1G4B9N8_9PEZI|nr:uncharacterized protein CORC01_06505 [Colletotrichum orchidophilum]OHE98137.1 hypothetical protein CORC01_06505 [Colletotrichum orchidophilum]